MTHIFTINKVNIAHDVYSGAIHVLDGAAFNILTEGSKIYPADETAEAQKEIDALTACGQLFSKPRGNAKEADTAFTQNRPQIVKSLCMHIAHECNLRCKYCFAGEGDYGAVAENERTVMTPETGKKAVDFLIAASGNRRNLEVDFFGGEPTLGFDTVKEVVDYARSREKAAGKNFRFTFTTNGLLLDDEKTDYINNNMNNVVLSLDGRKETNDKMRTAKNGSGCYDKIVPKFKKLTEARSHENYYIRGTYTNENLNFSNDVLHIADLGFKQISVEPVIGKKDASFAIREEHVKILCDEYEKLAVLMSKRKKNKFNFFHFMLDPEGGPCAAKRITGCGAGTEYLACTPEGDLYPCHQFVGSGQFKLGDINTGIVQTAWRERFMKCNVYTKPECDACWAKFYCSGGCAANAYHVNGDIMKPDAIGCELQKKRIECAMYLLAVGG